MRKSFCAILGLLATVVGASAADMPVKAPPRNPFISYNGNSWYLFGGAFGGEADVTIVGANGGRLAATGAGVSAGAGWMWGRQTTWTAIDLRTNYATISTSGLCALGTACSLRQSISVEVRAKYGSDSTALANWLPNLGLSGLFDVLPALPAGAQTTSHPYLFGFSEVGRNRADVAFTDITSWRTDFGGGVGLVHQLGGTKALDTWAKCGVGTNGGATFRLGTTCKGGMDIIF